MGVSHNVRYIRISFETKKFFYINLIHYVICYIPLKGFGRLKNISYICITKIYLITKTIFMRVSNRIGMKFDCNRLWNWAYEKLGESRCGAIAFYWDTKEDAELGYYDWEKTIWINLAQCKRMISVQKTILHEWTHAQQSYRWYNHYQIKYGYKNNPYEIQARENEKLVKRAYRKNKR